MQYILRKIHLLRIIVFAKSNNLKLAVFFDNSSIKLFYYLFLLNWQRYSNYLISNSIIMEVIIFYFLIEYYSNEPAIFIAFCIPFICL